MKRVFAGILLIFSLSFLCGFTSKKEEISSDYIMLSLDFSSTGQIRQSLQFSVGSKKINEMSLSVKETLDFKKRLVEEITMLRNEFLFNFALIYLKNPDEQYKINKGVVISPVAYDEKSDLLGFEISFSNVDAWNYYHNANEENSAEKTSRNPLFIRKIKSEGAFPFSTSIADENGQKLTVGERYINIYLQASKNLSFCDKLTEEYSPQFIYNYSAYNPKLRSNADKIFYDKNGKLHHLWIVDCDKIDAKNSILIYYYFVNRGVWLVFALTVPLCVMFASIICIKIKEKGYIRLQRKR